MFLRMRSIGALSEIQKKNCSGIRSEARDPRLPVFCGAQCNRLYVHQEGWSSLSVAEFSCSWCGAEWWRASSHRCPVLQPPHCSPGLHVSSSIQQACPLWQQEGAFENALHIESLCLPASPFQQEKIQLFCEGLQVSHLPPTRQTLPPSSTVLTRPQPHLLSSSCNMLTWFMPQDLSFVPLPRFLWFRFLKDGI